MAIPFYAAEAGGGRIVALDDAAVVKDLASEAGSGGSTFSPYIVSTPVATSGGGWATLRRAVQHVHHDQGGVTVDIQALKDEAETGASIQDALAIGETFVVTAPLKAAGSTAQVKITLSSFDAPVELGIAELWMVARRRRR